MDSTLIPSAQPRRYGDERGPFRATGVPAMVSDRGILDEPMMKQAGLQVERGRRALRATPGDVIARHALHAFSS